MSDRKKNMPTFVTIVSGLPRSGTSMMMKMLEAGGMQVLTDNIRKADADNPGGYYEFEKVKQTKQDPSWLDDAEGKAVKMVSRLLYDLPPGRSYRVIFMQRQMEEILASQRRMLSRLGKNNNGLGDDKMAALFQKHLKKVEKWLSMQNNFEVLYVNYNAILENAYIYLEAIDQFLKNCLAIGHMAGAIDPALYRQRH